MPNVFFFYILVDDIGIKVLFKRLRRDRLDDISHKSGDLEYKFYR